MVQSKISLTVLGFLGFSLLVAVVWQQSNPHYLHYQPLWQDSEYAGSRSLQGHSSATEHYHRHLTSHKVCPLHGHTHEAIHEHRSPGKPGAEVSLHSPGVLSLPLLQSTEVGLELHTDLTEGQLRVTLETSPQLQLLNNGQQQVFELGQGDGDTLQLPMTLMAISGGTHHVHLFIEHTDPSGIVTARALATEFRVGVALVEKLFDKNLSMSDPNRMVSLPGKETIY